MQLEKLHTYDASEDKTSTHEKIAKIEHSIGKLEVELNSLSEITKFKDQIPSLLTIQLNINEIKKKCSNSISAIDTKAEKYDQIQKAFTDTNAETIKSLQEEIEARQSDVKKLSEKILNLERQVKSTSTKNQIVISDKDIKHQENFLRVATELSTQVDSEKEFIIDSMHQSEERKESSKALRKDIRIIRAISPYEFVKDIFYTKQCCMNSIIFTILTNTSMKEHQEAIRAFESASSMISQSFQAFVRSGIKACQIIIMNMNKMKNNEDTNGTANAVKQQLKALADSTTEKIQELNKQVGELPSTKPLDYGDRMCESIFSSIKKYEDFINEQIAKYQKEIGSAAIDSSLKLKISKEDA